MLDFVNSNSWFVRCRNFVSSLHLKFVFDLRAFVSLVVADFHWALILVFVVEFEVSAEMTRQDEILALQLWLLAAANSASFVAHSELVAEFYGLAEHFDFDFAVAARIVALRRSRDRGAVRPLRTETRCGRDKSFRG